MARGRASHGEMRRRRAVQRRRPQASRGARAVRCGGVPRLAARAAAALQQHKQLNAVLGRVHCCMLAAQRTAAFLQAAVPAVGVAQSEAVSVARTAPADKNARPHAAKAVRTQRIRNRWTASMPGIVATATRSY